MRRRAVQAVDEPPVVQIEREAIITTQYQVGRMQQVRWLASVTFKSSAKALSALLSDPTQPDKKMAHRAHSRRRRGQGSSRRAAYRLLPVLPERRGGRPPAPPRPPPRKAQRLE